MYYCKMSKITGPTLPLKQAINSIEDLQANSDKCFLCRMNRDNVFETWGVKTKNELINILRFDFNQNQGHQWGPYSFGWSCKNCGWNMPSSFKNHLSEQQMQDQLKCYEIEGNKKRAAQVMTQGTNVYISRKEKEERKRKGKYVQKKQVMSILNLSLAFGLTLIILLLLWIYHKTTN